MSGRGQAIALVVLVAAVAVCALVIYVGPIVAELFLSEESSPAFADSVFTIVLFGALLLAGIIGGRLCGVKALSPGERPAGAAAVGFAIGAAGLLLAAGYAWLSGTLTQQPTESGAALFLLGTLLVILQAGSEEVYFRGWLQPVLARQWGAWVGIVLAAIAFAVLHIIGGASTPISILNLFLGGMLFGLLADGRGGIAAPVAAHIAWNWTEQQVLGLTPNPGLGSFGSILNLELGGPVLWGGSEEGLNASLAMTFALAIFVVPLMVLQRGRLGVTPPAATAPGQSGPAPA